MATIEEVVEMWDNIHQNDPNVQTKPLKGKNVQPDGKIKSGTIYDRLSKWAVIKLSDARLFAQWNERICYVFDFKSNKPEINFQRRSGYPCDTEKLYEFLDENFNGKEINGKKLTLARGRNPDNLILKINFDRDSSAKEICDCMEELIKLTREKICNFLGIKFKDEEKLSTENHEIFSEIMNKYKIKEGSKLYEKCKDIYNQTMTILDHLYVGGDKSISFEVSHYTQKNIARSLLIAPKDKRSKFRLYYTYGMNDPSEGKTLLSFLEIKSEDLELPEDLPFIACFSLEINSLNQFRLYGNEDNKEANGVSIVFKFDFFNESRSLYRCVYIDPDERKIKSIPFSKKDGNSKEVKNKQKEVKKLFEKLKSKTQEFLKIDNKNINKSELAKDLLINIRYLVKDYAFTEERECRIIDMRNKKEDKIDIHGERLYIEIGEIKDDDVREIYFAPLAEGKEVFEAKTDIKCIRSRHPYKSKELRKMTPQLAGTP